MSNFLKAAGAVVGLSLALIVIFTARPLTVIPPDPDPTHPFQTERAFERLVRILGDETPHPVDSDANDAVRERLVGEIEALGFSPIVRDDFHCPVKPGLGACARVRNVLFWATAPGPNAVMLASHYDSVPPGPGAADDGAGVAISLEIAALMKGRALERPLLVLITDGEETGLIGASSFVNTDPLAKLVTAVVSMEARGVRGLASMFQTGRPNGRDTAFLKRPSTRIAKTSSLDTDVYELLPNDTDLTQYLNLPIDAANFAFVGGAAFYHTPHDDLAHLDKRSLFHMGANALAATETFLEQSGDEEDSQKIYVDVMGATVLMMPQAWGVPVLGLGLVIFAITFLRAEGAPFAPRFFRRCRSCWDSALQSASVLRSEPYGRRRNSAPRIHGLSAPRKTPRVFSAPRLCFCFSTDQKRKHGFSIPGFSGSRPSVSPWRWRSPAGPLYSRLSSCS